MMVYFKTKKIAIQTKLNFLKRKKLQNKILKSFKSISKIILAFKVTKKLNLKKI